MTGGSNVAGRTYCFEFFFICFSRLLLGLKFHISILFVDSPTTCAAEPI
jgi:hypothetical protein